MLARHHAKNIVVGTCSSASVPVLKRHAPNGQPAHFSHSQLGSLGATLAVARTTPSSDATLMAAIPTYTT